MIEHNEIGVLKSSNSITSTLFQRSGSHIRLFTNTLTRGPLGGLKTQIFLLSNEGLETEVSSSSHLLITNPEINLETLYRVHYKALGV